MATSVDSAERDSKSFWSQDVRGREILRTNILRTYSITSLLVGALLTVLNSSVWSESILFSGAAGKNPCLTHTVFHGSDHRYDTLSDLRLRDDPFDNISAPSTNFDRGPVAWKYKISVTVFWVGEQAAEANPISNTESAWDASWIEHYGGER